MALLIENVRIEPVQYHDAMLDGRWWPASDDPAAELPGLVEVLNGVRGPIVRLMLSAAGWATRPHQILAGGRVVSLGYFADRSPTLLTAISADGGTVTVLVIR
jgi:hypothetical protein